MSESVNSKQLAVNSWKYVPHLFANGKFRVRISDVEVIHLNARTLDKVDELLILSDDCTLIARPILDMSDEEIRKKFPRSNKQDLHDAVCNEEMFADEFLYLLSIGVYPFDQEHFENGDVIARYENKDTESLNTQNSTLNTAKP